MRSALEPAREEMERMNEEIQRAIAAWRTEHADLLEELRQ